MAGKSAEKTGQLDSAVKEQADARAERAQDAAADGASVDAEPTGGVGGEGRSHGDSGSAGEAGIDIQPPPTAAGPQGLSWSPLTPLETGAADVGRSTFARNRNGDTVVAWWQQENNGGVWVRRYLDAAWDNAPLHILAMPNNTEVKEPIQVAIDGQGTAHVFYLERGRSHWLSWQGQEIDAMGISAPDAGITAADDVDGNRPLAMNVDDFGNGSAVWYDIRQMSSMPKTSILPVWCNRYTTSTTWQSAMMLDTLQYEQLEDSRPLFNALPATASETGWFASGIAVGTLYLDVGMAKQDGEIRTVVGRDCDVTLPPPIRFATSYRDPSYRIDGAGNVMMLVQVERAGTQALEWTRYQPSAKLWSAPEPLSTQNVDAYALTMTPDRQAIALWFERSSGAAQSHLVSSRYESSTGWSAPETLGADVTLEPSGLVADVNSAGRVVVVWAQTLQDDSQAKAIYHQHYLPSQGWSQPDMVGKFDGTVSVQGLTVGEDGRALLLLLEAAPGSNVHDLVWSASL